MLLREVVGNDQSSNQTAETVRLDGEEVSRQTLDERKNDNSVRVIETSKDNFKTLKHLQG